MSTKLLNAFIYAQQTRGIPFNVWHGMALCNNNRKWANSNVLISHLNYKLTEAVAPYPEVWPYTGLLGPL